MAAVEKLVLDASVWINLLATEQPWTIIHALGMQCLTPEDVLREVKRDPITRQTYSFDKHPFRRQPNVEIVELSAEELDLFVELVARDSVEALGDGEAAAIAVARMRQCAVALDDRKARRIVQSRYPEMRILMTVDILLHRGVRARLGEEASESAFAKAIKFGRMYVPKS